MPKRTLKKKRIKGKGGQKRRKKARVCTREPENGTAVEGEEGGCAGETVESGDTELPVKNTNEFSANWKALSKQQLSLEKSTKSKSFTSGRTKDSKKRTQLKAQSTNGQSFAGRGVKRKRLDSKESTAGNKKRSVWFDDVAMEMVEGEPVLMETSVQSSPLISGTDTKPGKCIALDCEMVGTGSDGSFSMLARCSLVNHHGNKLYDSYVSPMDNITDYRTQFSGIRPRNLEGAPTFTAVQKSVADLLHGRILVGHGIRNDLKALLLSHPKKDIRDTARYPPFRRLSKGGQPSLKKLAKELLGLDIQHREHSSVEDAQVAMRLYQLHKKNWEEHIKWKRGGRGGRGGGGEGGQRERGGLRGEKKEELKLKSLEKQLFIAEGLCDESA